MEEGGGGWKQRLPSRMILRNCQHLFFLLAEDEYQTVQLVKEEGWRRLLSGIVLLVVAAAALVVAPPFSHL